MEKIKKEVNGKVVKSFEVTKEEDDYGCCDNYRIKIVFKDKTSILVVTTEKPVIIFYK